MIRLTLLDNSDIVVNADMVEFVEKTPDTVISLSTGRRIVVRESVDDVIDRVINYKRQMTVGAPQSIRQTAVGG
jgi:flagellar protein FlbD